MFRKIAYKIQDRKNKKDLLKATGVKPEHLIVFGKVFARWGVKVVLGKNVTFGNNVVLYGDGIIEIGDDVFINDGAMIYASRAAGVVIGSGTAIAPFCYITDSDHSIDKSTPIRLQKPISSKVTIGKECWLGAHACILKGSIVHDGAVVGAGAVVKGEIPENAVAVGVPAKVIKFRK